VELGDERWTDLLAEYGRRADLAVATHAGRIVDRSQAAKNNRRFAAVSWS
jgi:class 3 adenylate cyclase